MATTIPRAVLEYVTEEVNALSADAQARVLRVLEAIEWTHDNVAECRDIVLQALAAVMPTYTDAAAQAGADLYDAVRETAVGERMGATAISGYEPDAMEGAVRAFVQDIVDGKSVESKVPTPHPSPSASHRCTRMFIPGWSTSQILPSPLQSVSDSIHAELNDSAGPGSDWRPPNPPRWNSKSSGRSGISLLNRLPALPERLEPVRWPAEG